MLRLIQVSGMPVGIPVVRTIRCQPGMFGQLNKKGQVVVSDGTSPIGIIDEHKDDAENTIVNKCAAVWTVRGIYATDQVEKRCSFLTARLLYVSNRGRLTTRCRSKSHRSVGVVVSYLSGVLEFWFWG